MVNQTIFWKSLLSPPLFKCAVKGKLRPEAYKQKQKQKIKQTNEENIALSLC